MERIPDATLLIQDFLSPATTQLSSTTPQLLTYHLAKLPLEQPHLALLTSLLTYLSTSPALWRGQASPSSTSPQWTPLNFGRAQEVYTALFQGCLYRAGEVTRELGTGWNARRKYAAFFEAYLAGANAEKEGMCHPVVRLLTASAALAALQAIKMRKDKLYVGGSALMGRAEQEVLKAWHEYFREEERDHRGSAANGAATEWTGSAADNANELPAWLAAQTLPLFPVASLAEGPLPQLLHLLSVAHSAAFASGHLFSTLSSSLIQTLDGLAWTIPSESHTLLSGLIASPIFNALGPLSRSIGRLGEAAGARAKAHPDDHSTLIAVRNFSTTLERVVSRIQKGWSSTAWSEIEIDSALTPATRAQTEPWSLLKSLLFSITLIHSSLLVIVSPKPGRKPTPLQLDLAKQAVRVLGKTYFITIKFGTDGFSAWKGAWVGLMEVVEQDSQKALEALMQELEPAGLGRLQERTVERSEATFYMNAAEQLMKPLGDDYVEASVLRCCYPYLETTTYRDTFESAHSVLLAVFATTKRCANDLAPWYTKLLLQAYPSLMSASQLRLAFTTIIRCVSSSDDALAWYCILKLIEAIRALPASSAELKSASTSTSSAPPSQLATRSPVSPPSSSSTPLPTKRDYDEEATQTRLDESSLLSPLEQRALTLHRGHLLLTLIDQTTSVNLILLRKLLDEIWGFIKEEGAGVDEVLGSSEEETPKEALVKVVFGTLGEGLDATKREEGVRYWMEHGEELAGP